MPETTKQHLRTTHLSMIADERSSPLHD